MKFLQAAVLYVICVGYVTASDPDYVGDLGLHMAIDKGRLDIAVDLVKQDETLVKDGVRYVIRKDDPDLIANFVNQTNQANASTLDVLLLGGSPIETVEKVLEKVDFPQQALIDFASSYTGVYYPETFLVLLDKIVKPEDQEKAVEKGIEQLAHSSTEISPLLNALKGKTFRSKRLDHFAIQKTFMEGAKNGRAGLLPVDICNHAAITPELYADALVVVADWEKYYMRHFLLKNADCSDLQAVKEKAGYADLNREFRDDIEKALENAKSEGTRTRAYDIQTVEKARETFEGLDHPGIPEDVFSIVSEAVMRNPPKRREDQIASKKAPEKVVNDVTSTSTTKTESSKIRKRKGGKGKRKGGKGKRKGKGKK